MSPKFLPGDKVYLSNGRKVEFIVDVGDGFIVKPGYKDEYEEYFDGFMKVDRIFFNAPTELYTADLDRLQNSIDNLNEEIKKKREELNQLKNDEKNTINILKQAEKYKGLERIKDIIDGNFTHFVIIRKYDEIIIQEKQIALLQEDFGKKMKLLSLFGDSNGNLTWELNRYRDGSGVWMHVIPCFSYEEALTIAEKEINNIYDIWRNGDRNSSSLLSNAYNASIKLKLKIPDDVEKYFHEQKIKISKENVEKAKKTYEYALKILKELNS